jgi:phytoene dehydrogenase-like protein
MKGSTAHNSSFISAPSRHFYDLVVIGSHLAGLASAALVARKGYKVLVLETTLPYEHQSHPFAYEPILLPNPRHSALLSAFLNEMQLTTVFQRTAIPLSTQWIAPRQRIDFPASVEDNAREWQKLFGEESLPQLKAFLEFQTQSQAFLKALPNLPPQGMLEGWSLRRQARLFESSPQDWPQTGAWPSLQLMASLGLGTQASPHALQHFGGLALLGSYGFYQGRQGFGEWLIRRMQQLGADVVYPSQLTQLAFDNKGCSLQLRGDSTVYRVRTALCAMEVESFARFLEDSATLKYPSSSPSSSCRVHLHWLLPQEALPYALKEQALLPSLWLQNIPAAPPERGALEPLRILTASSWLEGEVSKPRLEAQLARMTQSLETLLPFARQHLRIASSPQLDAPRERIHEARLPLMLNNPEVDGGMGFCGELIESKRKSLLIANRQQLPGLGVEGELLLAFKTSKAIEQQLLKKPPRH